MFRSTPYTAIIPAAGKGSRMGPLSHSKELLTVGREDAENRSKQLVPVASFLFERIREAGVRKIHLILRKGKNDLINRFQSGQEWGVSIAYHLTETDLGVPFTVDQAYPFTRGQNIVFGFPDILFHPRDAFEKMIHRLEKENETDLLLGLFPVQDQSRWDTVILSEQHQVTDVLIKEPSDDPQRFAWILAAWKPVFSDFIHKRNSEILKTPDRYAHEIQMGEYIRAAIEEGMIVKGLAFPEGNCLDIGTPEGYKESELFLKEHG